MLYPNIGTALSIDEYGRSRECYTATSGIERCKVTDST